MRLLNPLQLLPLCRFSGYVILTLALLMLLPWLADLMSHRPPLSGFLYAGVAGVFFGGAIILSCRGLKLRLATGQIFLMTAMSWLIVPLFASIPLMLEAKMSFSDAFFEAMSGITSCGASIVQNFSLLSPGVLLWRAVLNWIGGIGIIAIAIAVLPMLQVGGMALFKTEFSDRSDNILPRARQLASTLMRLYVAFTCAMLLALHYAGMSWFDALCHALTCVSSGGFSNYFNSIQAFNNLRVEIVIMIGMFISALPFVLMIQAIQGRPISLWKDSQVRCFAFILLPVMMVMMVCWLHWHQEYQWGEAWRYGTFNVLSVMTTTGYYNTDYATFGSFAMVLLTVAVLIGGCTGSTSGGLRVYRVRVIASTILCQCKQLIYPNGIFYSTYNGRPLPTQVVMSVMVFVTTFFLIFMITWLLVSLEGCDFVTGMSASVSALTNAGFGLGAVGPSGSFGVLHDSTKWVLAVAMLLGRLEFFTLLVLLTPTFWRS
jgi:trk system potassium uptake protein TrkH